MTIKTCDPYCLAGGEPKSAKPREKRVREGYTFLPGLRLEMDRQRVTRKLLSVMVESNPDTVGAWAKQKTRCPPAKQKALAEALGVSVTRLRTEES